jgi:hypothetical protein
MAKLDFDPPLAPEEKELFLEYFRARKSHYNIKHQKRHAEAMLELYRPQLYRVYSLQKDGRGLRETAREIQISQYATKRRQLLAIKWMSLALLGRAAV